MDEIKIELRLKPEHAKKLNRDELTKMNFGDVIYDFKFDDLEKEVIGSTKGKILMAIARYANLSNYIRGHRIRKSGRVLNVFPDK